MVNYSKEFVSISRDVINWIYVTQYKNKIVGLYDTIEFRATGKYLEYFNDAYNAWYNTVRPTTTINTAIDRVLIDDNELHFQSANFKEYALGGIGITMSKQYNSDVFRIQLRFADRSAMNAFVDDLIAAGVFAGFKSMDNSNALISRTLFTK